MSSLFNDQKLEQMVTLFIRYNQFVNSRAKKLDTVHQDLLHAAVGLSTESGEFLDTLKKIWIYAQDLDTVNKEGKTHRTNLIEEMGDLLFYMQLACNRLNVSIPEIIEMNMEKLTKRYPNGYSDAAAAARADKTSERS